MLRTKTVISLEIILDAHTSSGAANSSFALVFLWSVTLLMARSVFFFLSPTTTHQASVLDLGYSGAQTCKIKSPQKQARNNGDDR